MRTKKSNMVVVLLLTLIGIIITGLFVAWMVGFVKDKKQSMNTSSDKTNSVISSIADFDTDAYDGKTINGSTLKELIKEYKKKDTKISIWVYTLDTTNSYYNYNYESSNLGAAVTITPPPSKTTAGYITPTESFLGEVIRNTNNEVVCLKFTQQK